MQPRRSSSAFTQPYGVAAGPLAAVAALISLAAASAAPAQQTLSGGAEALTRPVVKKVKCVRSCASRKRAKAGSLLRIDGKSLAAAKTVVFHGGPSKADDSYGVAEPVSDTRIRVRVPAAATAGGISVFVDHELGSRRTRPIKILPPPPPEPNTELTPVPGPRQAGAPRLETGTSRTKAYFGARRTVTFSFRVSESAPAALRVEVVRAADGAVLKTWTPQVVAGEIQRVTWNGKAGTAPAPPGRHFFRLTASTPSGAVARSAQSANVTRDAFDLYENIFPVRGKHDYGGANARFGVGRAGHSHQGHDVFARCGTRMVAARGGRVRFTGYHGAAGNYVVIDGGSTDIDYAYMHLTDPSPFSAGDRVYTGQQIGTVGDTGNASGCHLHFELWGGPGWYEGGAPFDPYPSLKAWDAYS